MMRQKGVLLCFSLKLCVFAVGVCSAYHISMGVEYSVEPRSTSGGRYHNVTTSLE